MGARLYVGNLNYRTTADGLRAAIEARGRKVKDLAIINDKESGQSKGFAFVELVIEGTLRAAIDELNGMQVDGRQLRVSEATERPAGNAPRPGGPGGGYGERGGFRDHGGRGGRDEGGGARRSSNDPGGGRRPDRY